MEKSKTRKLDFNGKSISILLADGTWWIALKPICEALDINFDRQYKNLMDDEILSQLYAKQHTVGADDKLREMVCLPEKFIYGWLFSIRSESPILKKYKLECYEVLYHHFHGVLDLRTNALMERLDTLQQIAELQDKLNTKWADSAEYLKIQELKTWQKQITKMLAEADEDLLKGQMRLSI